MRMAMKGETVNGSRLEYQIKQYVCVLHTGHSRFMVFTTGDPKVWLFCQVDDNLCATGLSTPIARADVRPQFRQLLAHGIGFDLRRYGYGTRP